MRTAPAPSRPLPFDGGHPGRRWLWLGCALVVLAGVLVQVFRPVAPALGEVPEAARWFDAAHLDRVRAYWGPRYAAGLLSLVVQVAVPLLVAGTAAGRRLVAAVVRRVGVDRPALAGAVVGVGVLVVSDVVRLPLAFWIGYVHEGAYGFRVQGFGGWARDWLVFGAPSWLAAGVLVGGGFRLARSLPRSWPLVAGLLGAGLVVVVVFAAPVVLEPFRFTTTPLPEGPVRDQVTVLVERSGIPADTVLVADAGRRTTRHNAYVSGLAGSRRVVLYDTLLADRPVEEVAMVVAHELGHERNADVLRATLTGAAGTVLLALSIGLLVRRRMGGGRQAEAADPRAVPAIVALVVVANLLALPAQQALSRRAEAAADLAALELTADPQTFLVKTRELAIRNLSDPDPPWWARALWSSHPSATERLAMGERWTSTATPAGQGTSGLPRTPKGRMHNSAAPLPFRRASANLPVVAALLLEAPPRP